MAEYSGSSLYLTFGTIVLSSDFRSFDRSDETAIIDATAGSDSFKVKLTAVADGKSSVELLAQTSGTVLWAALAPGPAANLVISEEGTASGKPKTTVSAFAVNRARKVVYDDVVVISVDFEHTAAPTESTW